MSNPIKRNAQRILDLLSPISEGYFKILDTTGFSQGVGDGELPEHLRNENIDKPQKKDRPEEIPQPIPPNISDDDNIVYREPVYIFNDNSTTINNFNEEAIDRPSSLLPVERGVERLTNNPTKVAIGAPITLAQSIANQQFGQMLFNPFSSKKQKIRQANNTKLKRNLEILNELGIESFSKYLAGEEGYSAQDAIVLLMPIGLRGLSGNLSALFGYDTIKYYFSNFTAASVNALIGISDTIPIGYEIKEYEPQYVAVPHLIDNLAISPQEGSEGILLDELFDEPVNFEKWIEEAVTLQYGEENDQENSVEIETFSDLIRHALAPFYFRTGLKDLPFTLPENLIQDPKPGDTEAQVKTKRLSEFLLWQIQAFDSVIGQFPIKIRIEDSDLIKTGDQPLELEFPNLAETLTEMIGLSLANQTNNNALLSMNSIEMIEIAQTKQQAVQNYYLSAAIQEYLGFKTKQISKDIDFAFNPGILAEEPKDQTLENMLKPSTIKMIIESNDDDDTLEKYMYTLVEAARIIKAVHWQNVDLRNNPSGQIANIIKKAKSIADALKDTEEKDLEDFLENIESGFANKFVNKDATRPYGRNYSERPRIKQRIEDANDSIT